MSDVTAEIMDKIYKRAYDQGWQDAIDAASKRLKDAIKREQDGTPDLFTNDESVDDSSVADVVTTTLDYSWRLIRNLKPPETEGNDE